jgi:hypothetical protein
MFHYIHYYPNMWDVSPVWGWTITRYRDQLTIDWLVGRHTIVWAFMRNHG